MACTLALWKGGVKWWSKTSDNFRQRFKNNQNLDLSLFWNKSYAVSIHKFHHSNWKKITKLIYRYFVFFEITTRLSDFQTVGLSTCRKTLFRYEEFRADFEPFPTIWWGRIKQEAHGPHRSSENPVQINKHIFSELWLCNNVDLERKK